MIASLHETRRLVVDSCQLGRAPAPSGGPRGAADGLKLGDVTFTGTLRSRLYGWDWFQAATGDNQYGYSGNLLRLNFAEKLATWDWDAEFAVPFLLGLPTGATDAAPQGALGFGSNYYTANHNSRSTAMIFPRQLFARFRGLGGITGQTLLIGRFTFLDGSEIAPRNSTLATLKRDRVSARLLGDFGFTDVGRSFDGVHYSYTKASDDFTFVAAIPTRGVFQTDGWGWNRVGFGYAAYTHEWGTGRHSADTRFFALEYDDWRHILKTDNRPTAIRTGDTENIRINTFGGHSLHAFTTNAGHTGRSGTGEPRRPGAGARSSSAPTRSISRAAFSRRFFPLETPAAQTMAARRIHDGLRRQESQRQHAWDVLPASAHAAPLRRFPFFNMMNSQDRFGSLIQRPHSKITISSEFHALRLSDPNDLWYSGGGVFQPWTFGYTGRSTSGRRSLANLYDTSVEYRANRRITLTAYVGYAQGLAAMKEIYAQGKNGQLGYLELLYRF